MKRLWEILGILLGTALLLNVVTEILNRKSFVGTVRFMIHAPMVFLLDTLLLLTPFLLVFFTKRKVFLAVVLFVTGFTAATYLRGIDFIQIPTSLLAQVDSSIGGKTGVDFRAYKNMVGAFHQPKLVYSCAETLKTLTEQQYISGLGEIIKHGLIKAIAYYHWLKEHKEAILSRDTQTMIEMIEVSCRIKKEVVENDPEEAGERALLNFGHTLGHAVEKLMNFTMLHGECVAVGMHGAAWLSKEKNMISEEIYRDILDTLTSFGLPVSVEGITPARIVEVSKSDKKMDKGKVKFILLNPEGQAVIDRSITDAQLLAAADALVRNGEQKL